tara:strand:+ start:444 stop:557 length:114 start_codon:yes stop_codon:yes gene_type:complete
MESLAIIGDMARIGMLVSNKKVFISFIESIGSTLKLD